MVTVRADVTLEVVLRYLRRFDELPDHTDQLFVVDREERLQRRAAARTRLLVSDPEADGRRRSCVADGAAAAARRRGRRGGPGVRALRPGLGAGGGRQRQADRPR
ncbi:MAG: hypothetical protein MZW92_63805 [Comamonadaceae bacterium]|nr:hypothetical protein [Comamonadaceae bacterium]